MAPNCDSDSVLPVLQRPDPPTQLSLLSQSMMDQQVIDSDVNDSKITNVWLDIVRWHFNTRYLMLETEGGDCDHISHLGKCGQLVALLNWLMELHDYKVVIL